MDDLQKEELQTEKQQSTERVDFSPGPSSSHTYQSQGPVPPVLRSGPHVLSKGLQGDLWGQPREYSY